MPAAWLRLSLVSGVGPAAGRALLAAFGSPEDVFAAPRRALADVVSDDLARALLEQDLDARIAEALAWARAPGNLIVTLDDARYPKQLLDTDDPPLLLYVKGRVELLSQPALAIVGSRNATPQGIANAEAFARALSQAGLAIVSGMALGIDAAAHRGALQADGPTIAVIGTGADRIYPARNGELARRIAAEGAIVSEFPLGTPALASNFPRRNRLISGLARAVLVVEAAERSGSLITARLAAEQGRDVFAVPGSIHSPLSKGCHRLIKDGAKLVDDVRDILDELAPGSVAAPAPATAPSEHEALLALMGHDTCHVDTLAERSGVTPERLAAALLALELAGRIAVLPGGRYQRLD